MTIQRFGSDYGHFHCDPDLIPQGATILDCGVGTDISFAEGLHAARPDTRFVLVDHMDESERFVNKVRGYSWTTFIKAAVTARGAGTTVQMHKHRTDSGSETLYADHHFANPRARYTVAAVSLADLIATHKPALVKMDCEGVEYSCLQEAIGVPQVCVEFHHRMMSAFTSADTERIIAEFVAAGYSVGHRTATDEVLMVRK